MAKTGRFIGSAIMLGVLAVIASASASANDSRAPEKGAVCVDGLILSAWTPKENLSGGQMFFRGLVYFLAMVYLFIGVSIVSERFMAGIEMITSQEREVKVKKRNGEKQIVVVRVWNETVANLTLMALGSSAPEILLSIIEIMGKGFEAGELGPGTIVGSAAFNLFVIIAICIVVIPNGEVRRIKHLRVFFMTAFWSVFAYIWLYAILAVISPGRVEVWEALLTFIFFPITVLCAYIAERRLLVYKYLDKNYRVNRRGVVVSAEGAEEEHLQLKNRNDEVKAIEENGQHIPDEMREFEECRKEYISTIKQLRKKYPYNNLDQLEIMAMKEVIDKGYKSRAFYRILTTRKILRSGDLLKKILQRAQNEMTPDLINVHVDSESKDVSEIYFDPAHYTVLESCGQVLIRVVRRGGLSHEVRVDYETKDGSAETGADYVGKKGTLYFPPAMVERQFRIQIIDDDLFEQDQHFYVRLNNCVGPATLVTPNVATVMVLDDDHAGIFSFGSKDYKFVESIGIYTLKVHRYMGARGKVRIPYWTENGTAKSGKDYEQQKGELLFGDNETE